jgi:CHAT domain-containing protein/tetratricopeptide (TPR) repeat protein
LVLACAAAAAATAADAPPPPPPPPATMPLKPIALPDWLPTTAPSTQPAWMVIDKQWEFLHRMHRFKSLMSLPDGRLEAAEQFFSDLQRLTAEGRGREAVEGELPENLKGGAPVQSLPGIEFKPFNFNSLNKTMAITLNLKTLRDGLGEDDYEYLQTLYWLSIAYRSCNDYGSGEAAEHHASNACKTLEQLLAGRSHPVYGMCLLELANDKLLLHKYDEAEQLLRESLRVLIDTLGHDHLFLARVYNDLGTMYIFTARLPQATQQYQKARQLLENPAAPGRDEGMGTLHVAVLMNLATLAGVMQGDTARARQCLGDALAELEALNRKSPGRYQILRATCLLELGKVLLESPEASDADVREAEARLNEARVVYEREFGSEHPETARLWMTLGGLYLRAGRPQSDKFKGRELYSAAMAVFEKAKDRSEYDRVNRLQALMGEALVKGQVQQVLAYVQEGLEVARKVFGESHPMVAMHLSEIALIQEKLGRLDEAQAALGAALRLIRRHLDLSFIAQTEDEQLRMTQLYRSFVDLWLSIRLRHRPADAAASEYDRQTWAEVLSWKGTVFAQQRALHQLRRNGSPRMRELFKQMEDDGRELQSLVYAKAAAGAAEPNPQRDAKIDALRRRADEVQAELSAEIAALLPQRPKDDDGTAAVQRVLPPGAVLVDILRYRDVPMLAPGALGARGEERYVAFVVSADRVTAIPLGPAPPIDAALERWRRDEQFQLAPGLELRRLVWAELERALAPAGGGAIRLVLISPDGPLAMLPFAALPADAEGHTYLLEQLALATIPVPQLLPSLLAHAGPSSTVNSAEAVATAPSAALLVGGIDFNSGARPVAAVATSQPTAATLAMAAAATPQDVVVPRGSADGPWIELPGTTQEIDRVREVFRAAAPRVATEPLMGSAADKTAFLKALADKQYVHVATHAFFAAAGIRSVIAPAPPPPPPPPDASQSVKVAGPGAAQISNATSTTAMGIAAAGAFEPGLLSGLVFAGANRPQQFDAAGRPLTDDGILTALEVSQLDLSNLKLVVLSACETALGKAAGGEGLLGLQRAFQLSGSRTVVASMWKVDDRKTSELMIELYQQLLARHEPPVLALRKAQLAILSGNGPAGANAPRTRGIVHDAAPTTGPMANSGTRLPPSLWAAWVVSGDPGDLGAAVAELEGRGPPLSAAPQPPPIAAAAPVPTAAPTRLTRVLAINLSVLIALVVFTVIWRRARLRP